MSERKSILTPMVRAWLGITAALAVLSGILPAGASASRTQWSIFEDHPYLVRTDSATRERTLDEITQLGADTLRVEVKWDEVAPNPASRIRAAVRRHEPVGVSGLRAVRRAGQERNSQRPPDAGHDHRGRTSLGHLR